MPRDAFPRVRMIVGPTASGKTGRAIEEALGAGGAVISADSRCVYRGLDIGTAKPTVEERRGVAHHFVDHLDLGEPFSAGVFARQAEDVMEGLLGRGIVPIVAGGSTLYLDALRTGLADIPPVPETLRAALVARWEAEGLAPLVDALRLADPVLAGRLDLSNPMRVLRALEVYEASGTPLSVWQARAPAPRFAYDVVLLDPPRDELHRRINQRVVDMIEAGWLGEVEGLLARGVSPALEPLRTIGYREMVAVAEGRATLDEAIPLVQQRTRQYARRQLTYFRTRFSEVGNNGL